VESTPCLDPLNPLNWPVAAWRIARERPELVVVNWWMPFFGPAYTVSLWLAKRLCGTKVMYLVHNAVPHEKRPGDMLITRLGFSVADYFIVMSEAVKEDLLSIRPDARYALTPLPVFDIFGAPKDKPGAKSALGVDGPVILFFGLVRAYKGLDILLDAMPGILEKVDATLVVAGEFYEDRAGFERQIGRLGISGRVKLLDRFIPDEEVGDIFSASDILVLPYRSATQSGITQIAYVFGTPVIATDVGGLPEVVKDGVTGVIVPPGDPAALTEAVVRFFEEGGPDRYRDNIEKEMKRFSWEVMVEVIERMASDRG
jgi:glycosyltransferase involved in cell wall biosynthesis